MRVLRLPCPECRTPQALSCQAEGSYEHFTLALVSQTCGCDPYGAWEDVWEQAREIIFEDGGID